MLIANSGNAAYHIVFFLIVSTLAIHDLMREKLGLHTLDSLSNITLLSQILQLREFCGGELQN